MNKRGSINSEYDTNLMLLIDRISSFQSPTLGLGIYDMVNESYERITIKNPAEFRYNLEVCEKSYDALYAFTSRLPDLAAKIYSAHKDTPVKITLESDLESGIVYTVMVLIHPTYGMTNVTVSNALRAEAYKDKIMPRIYADFFLGDKCAR